MADTQVSSVFLNSSDPAPDSSDEEISNTDETDEGTAPVEHLLVHLEKTDCPNRRVLENSGDVVCGLCDIKNFQCGDADICKTTRLRSCLMCDSSAYLLQSNITQLVFKDVLNDHEHVSRIFHAVHVPQIVTAIRVKSRGNVSQIPNDIERFPYLTELILRRNHLQKIPNNLGRLRHMKILDLAYNGITEIPSVIYSLRLLEKLNLTANNIRFISSAILDLTQLKEIRLMGNPLISPPSTVCEEGIEAIRVYVLKYTGAVAAITTAAM